MLNKSELESRLSQISDKIDYYDYERVYLRKYILMLANGDKLKINFPQSSVAHMLGVNTNYLSSTGLFDSKNSYELLKEMCDNEYRIYNSIKNGIISENQLFSQHIDKKISSFVANLKINIYNLEFACKYEKERTFNNGNDSYDFDYALVKQNEDREIFMLGLVQNPNGVYVPMTNQYFANQQDADSKFQQILKDQSITLATGVQALDFDSFHLTAPAKYSKTSNLEEYARKYGAIVDVSSDYKWILSKFKEGLIQGGQVNVEHAAIISSCMLNAKFISPEDFELDDFSKLNPNLVKIIMGYNDFLSNNALGNNSENRESYSSLHNEVIELRKLKKELTSSNNELTESNIQLTDKNVELEEQLGKYKEKIKKINEISTL